MPRGLRVLGLAAVAAGLLTVGAHADSNEYGPDQFSGKIRTWLESAAGNRDRLNTYLAETGQDMAITDLIYAIDEPLARARSVVALRMGLDEISQEPDGNSARLQSWLDEDPAHGYVLEAYLEDSRLALNEPELLNLADPAVRFLRTYAVMHLIPEQSIEYARDENSALIAYWLRLKPENRTRLRGYLDSQGLQEIAITNLLFSKPAHYVSLRSHVVERYLEADTAL